jgi:hypothetical protein
MNNPNIASTIIDQLPRAAFTMMGAKDLVDMGNGLRWRVGRNAKRVTHVQVTLNASDTYDVATYRITKHGLNVELLDDVRGVYVDALRRVIESRTGLYLAM